MLSSAFEKNRAERARYFSMLKAAAQPKPPGEQGAQPPPATQPPTGQGVQQPGAQPTAGQGTQQPGVQTQPVQIRAAPPAMRSPVEWRRQWAAEEAAKQKAQAAARAAGREQLQQLTQNLNSNDPKERENARRQYVEAARNAGYGGYFEDYPGVSVDPEKWLDASKQVGYLVAAAQRASSQGDHSLSMALNKLEKKYRELVYAGRIPTFGTKPPSFNTYLKRLVYAGDLGRKLTEAGYTREANARLMNLLAGSTFEGQSAAAERTRREAEQRARARGEPVRVDWSDLYRPTPRGAPADVMPGKSDVKKPATQPTQAGGFRERRPPPAPGSPTGRSAHELPVDERFNITTAVHRGLDRNAHNALQNVFEANRYKTLNGRLLYDIGTEAAMAVKYNRPFDVGVVLNRYHIQVDNNDIAALNAAYRRSIANVRQRLGYQQAGRPAPTPSPASLANKPAQGLSDADRIRVLENVDLSDDVRSRLGKLFSRAGAREGAVNNAFYNMLINAITRDEIFDISSLLRRYNLKASYEEISAINDELNRAAADARKKLGLAPLNR